MCIYFKIIIIILMPLYYILCTKQNRRRNKYNKNKQISENPSIAVARNVPASCSVHQPLPPPPSSSSFSSSRRLLHVRSEHWMVAAEVEEKISFIKCGQSFASETNIYSPPPRLYATVQGSRLHRRRLFDKCTYVCNVVHISLGMYEARPSPRSGCE